MIDTRDYVFVDTSFWISLGVAEDRHHTQAVRWATYLNRQNRGLCTSMPVLWEMLNSLSAQSSRAYAVKIYRNCQSDPKLLLYGFVEESIGRAFGQYQNYRDKAWGMTDCYSFGIMREMGIKDALTADRHFVQAGFRALLLEEPPKV